MERNIYLCAGTAWSIWNSLRSLWIPRLDRLEPIAHILEQQGVKPARVSVISSTRELGAEGVLSRVAESIQALSVHIARSGGQGCWLDRSRLMPRATEAEAWAFVQAILGNRPVELLVGSKNERCRTHGVRCHLWGSAVAPDSFVSLGPGVFLATPEFALAQVCQPLHAAASALTAFEARGSYARARNGGVSSKRCYPMANETSLKRFMAGARGMRGLQALRDAVRMSLDGAASPLESAMVLPACAARTRGGFGMPSPRLNWKIEVPATLGGILGQRHVFCDACWPEAGVALEYDGREDHTGSAALRRDYGRANLLNALGYTLFAITKSELFNIDSYDSIMRQVAKAIGYRLNARDFTQRWRELHEELHAEMVRDAQTLDMASPVLGGAAALSV